MISLEVITSSLNFKSKAVGKHREQTTWLNLSVGKVIFAGALGIGTVHLSHL